MSEPERRIETSDDITHCLLELAFHNNNATRASKKLRADGWKVDRFTLLELRKKHPDRYERAREAQRTASMADDAEELAHTYAGIERKAADMLEDQIHELEPKELAATLRNVATARGISIQNASALRGRPTHITESRDASQIMRALAAKLGVQEAVDTTAIEYAELEAPGNDESPDP